MNHRTEIINGREVHILDDYHSEQPTSLLTAVMEGYSFSIEHEQVIDSRTFLIFENGDWAEVSEVESHQIGRSADTRDFLHHAYLKTVVDPADIGNSGEIRTRYWEVKILAETSFDLVWYSENGQGHFVMGTFPDVDSAREGISEAKAELLSQCGTDEQLQGIEKGRWVAVANDHHEFITLEEAA